MTDNSLQHVPQAGYSSEYWSRFPGFQHDPNASLVDEFNRLTTYMGWSITSRRHARRQADCYEAEFEAHFGTDGTKLEVWQQLCSEVGIDPAPVSINKCKKALRGVLVNLVDLIDQRRMGKPITKFASFQDFREYTQAGRIFSKKYAKDEGFLKTLLREIL